MSRGEHRPEGIVDIDNEHEMREILHTEDEKAEHEFDKKQQELRDKRRAITAAAQHVLESANVNELVKRLEFDQVLDLLQGTHDPSLTEQSDPNDPATQNLASDLAQVSQVNETARALAVEKRNLTAQYCIAGAGILSSLAGIATVIVATRALIDANSTPPVTSSDPEIVTVQTIVKTWISRSDSELWNELASYVQANESTISLDTELLFLNTISSMSRISAWIWESDTAKDAAVGASYNDYSQAQSSTPAMYRAILSRPYQNVNDNNAEQLPRDIAAEVLQLAIGRIKRSANQNFEPLAATAE